MEEENVEVEVFLFEASFGEVVDLGGEWGWCFGFFESA